MPTRAPSPSTTSQLSFGTGSNAHKVTINPTNNLIYGASYAAQIANTVIKDGANNNYAGISSTDTTTWNFTIAIHISNLN